MDECAFGDPFCPCQFGDACHYVDYGDGIKPMTPPDSDHIAAWNRAIREAEEFARRFKE